MAPATDLVRKKARRDGPHGSGHTQLGAMEGREGRPAEGEEGRQGEATHAGVGATFRAIKIPWLTDWPFRPGFGSFGLNLGAKGPNGTQSSNWGTTPI